MSVSVAMDYCKALNAAKRGAGRDEPLDEMDVAGNQDGAMSIERRIAIGEIEKSLEQVTRGRKGRLERTIFWLYYRQGYTAAAIARIPSVGLEVKVVENTIVRVTRRVREQMGETRPPELRTAKEITTEESL